MPLWCKSTLSAEEALTIANAHLENARKAQNRERVLKFCLGADTALRRIDYSAVTTNQSDLDQIIVAFREQGRILEVWNLSDKALKSYNKAKKLEGKNVSGTAVPSTTPAASQSPTSLQNTDVPSQGGSPALPAALAAGQPVLSQNTELIPSSIFAKDFYPHAFDGKLPGLDARLSDTRQLAYCLGLLQASSLPDNILDTPTRTWLHAAKESEFERERLKAMATDLLLEFTRDELKDAKAVTEVVCVAPVLDKEEFRFLLKKFVDSLSSPGLLDTHALEGLDEVIKSAPPRGIDSGDLVKILTHLNVCLQSTHPQSLDHMYRLTRVVSHVLDAMADGDVKGLDRVSLHAPLLTYLQNLKKSDDPYMVFQAAYAYQALLCVPDDEELWQTVLRRTGTVTKGLAGLVSAVKGLNVIEFMEGLGNIQEGLEGAGQFLGLVTDVYKGVTELAESGQSLRESLKEGFRFSGRRKWYPMLRATDTLLQNGELIKFKNMVCEAPCRGELEFQWGVCQRLGHVAADPLWDTDTRQGAIAFLGEIYRNDTLWGPEVRVKQCILNILMQLASASDDFKQPTEALLKDLEEQDDATKRTLYQACRKNGPSSHPWKTVLPRLTSSHLLDRVQKKAEVAPALRKLQHLRLEDRGQAVYIPPQAKASRQARDDDLFDLTEHVNEFLRSDQEVLLLMGDSGAGKSTFNRELEWELWDEYTKRKGRIPVFVSLPTIEKPEQDVIGKQLHNSGFNDVQIQELRDYHKFVLICDGYDECQSTRNLYNSNQLNKRGQWKAKMVISCRSEHLGKSYQSRFQPEDRNGQKGETLLREAVIAPFSKSKIRDYIEKYVEKYTSVQKTLWSVEDYLSKIEQIPSLQEIVRNPFLLMLSLEVMPDMVGLGGNVSSYKVTRVALYDKYVEKWVKDRGEERLVKRELIGDRKKAFEVLLDYGFQQNAIRFMKDLAVAIFDNQDGAPVVNIPPLHDAEKWQHAFFSQVDDRKTLLREACPIIRIGKGNQYRFIHQSILDYGLARAVFEPQTGGEDRNGEEETVVLAGQQGEDQGVMQEVSVCTMLVPDVSSPLYRKSFVNKPSVLQFLVERVQQKPIFKQELLAYIGQSRVDRKWSTAAANAITILVRAGIRFNGVDLRDISIPGADLSGGEFDNAQLQGADLSNTTLRNTWLRQANLNNTRMEGVEFGELPYLMEESEVRCCVYSSDEKACVFGLHNGTIRVYDTSTWAVTLTLQGHTDSISSVVYSCNGQRIASSSWDNTVRLWDAQTGAPGPILVGHTDSVRDVVYSPSGQQIASASDDNTVRLWDAQTGEPGQILSSHTDSVRNVVYSPSGQQLASGSFDNTVRLWDMQTGEPGPILSGHTHLVTSVVYSPDGQQIASGSWDGTVRLWDARTGEPGPILSGHTGYVLSLAYSPSGQQIASGSRDKTVRLWDARTGELGLILVGHTDAIRSVVYSPLTGLQIASGSHDKTVRLWNTQTGESGPILSGHTSTVLSVVYSPNGQQIATCSGDNTVRLWDAQAGAPGSILSGHIDAIRSVVCSPSGQQIASGSEDRTVRLWNAQTGEPGAILSGHTNIVTSVVYSPNGQQIASGSHGHKVRLWNAQTGAPGHILSGHTNSVCSVVYSPNGQQLASGSWDSTVRLWDAQTDEPGPILNGHTHLVTSVVYSPDGQQIASGSWDNTVRLWDARTGEPGPVLSDHTNYVLSLAYSPSGMQIASASWDNTVRLWDARTGEPGLILVGHTGIVLSVVYSPNGQQIASSSDDKTVRLWDAQSGVPGPILTGHTSFARSVVYSPNSMQIVTGSDDKTVRVWDADLGQCLTVVEDFHGPIASIAWSASPYDTCFATGSWDKSVRMWQVVQAEGHYQVRLRWTSTHDRLAASATSIQNVQGLSTVNKRLLMQRGAVGESTPL
ncbi:hypothetical protein EDD11_009764 [Mortierella claussenii]|nr:hypothetical protein EDD11_009764 [Mortierella claussenii]